MSTSYIIRPDKVYFVTLTVINWIDIFIRKNHKISIINSLKYCQKEKGLLIYCLMSSHLHMIVAADNGNNLSDILRDFKKFTSKQIVKAIQDEPESRREWMLDKFEFAARNTNKIKDYKFWTENNHAIELSIPAFTKQKVDYIHNNPVEEMIVTNAKDYLFSSAGNYAGEEGLLEINVLNLGLSRAY